MARFAVRVKNFSDGSETVFNINAQNELGARLDAFERIYGYEPDEVALEEATSIEEEKLPQNPQAKRIKLGVEMQVEMAMPPEGANDEDIIKIALKHFNVTVLHIDTDRH
jgi:hypothetical protein